MRFARLSLLFVQSIGALFVGTFCWMHATWPADDGWAFRATTSDWIAASIGRAFLSVGIALFIGVVVYLLNSGLKRTRLATVAVEPSAVAGAVALVVGAFGVTGAGWFYYTRPFL